MSTYIQWALYAKYENGDSLSEETAEEIFDVLEEHVDEWHSKEQTDDYLCEFLTTWNNGYSDITDAIAEYAKGAPEILFHLECHNEDEDWYQHIHFHGNDREELDAAIQYEKPQRIIYDVPDPVPQLMIVSQGSSVQGVFSDAIEAADVTLVDLDLNKLDAADDDEHIGTAVWINEKLTLSSSMNCLYGHVCEEV